MISCDKCGYGHKTFAEVEACKSWAEMEAERLAAQPASPSPATHTPENILSASQESVTLKMTLGTSVIVMDYLKSLGFTAQRVTEPATPEQRSGLLEIATRLKLWAEINRAAQLASKWLCDKHTEFAEGCKHCGIIKDCAGDTREELVTLILKWHDAWYALRAAQPAQGERE